MTTITTTIITIIITTITLIIIIYLFQSKPGEPDLVMHKKCLYIQKCVNTVVAILADEDLTEKSDLIKNLVRKNASL